MKGYRTISFLLLILCGFSLHSSIFAVNAEVNVTTHLNVTAISKFIWLGGDLTSSTNETNSKVPYQRYAPLTWSLPKGSEYDFIMTQGQIFTSSPSVRALNQNQMWKYSISSGNWTNSTSLDTPCKTRRFGDRYIPVDQNDPGCRSSAATFVDQSGRLWLFGGRKPLQDGTHQVLGDLWKLEFDKGWAFMGGCMTDQPCPPTYACGTTASPASVTLSAYASLGNNLYHYGGYVNPETPFSQDLWRYNVVDRQWYHLSTGPPTDPRRFSSCMVINPNGTMLYIYGGVTHGPSTYTVKADFWGFNLTLNSSNEWVEFNSSFSAGDGIDPLVYGIGHTGHPGARYDMSCWWSSDRFWLFGGENDIGTSYRNSLWYYDFDKSIWILTAASSDFQSNTWNFGNKSVASGGIPHKRGFSGTFIDSDENMYLFGGFAEVSGQYKTFSDFWKIIPSPKNATIGNTTTCGTIVNTDPNVCHGHGICSAINECDCLPGYGGKYCELYSCFGNVNGCNGGKCTGIDQCSCQNGTFIGKQCEFPICYGLPSNDSSVCSNMRGQCISPNNCSCGPYVGLQCELNSCFGKLGSDPTVCNGHGTCYDTNKCECKIGYYGNDAESCSKWTCDDIEHSKSGVVCGGRGNCTDYNTCVCGDHRYTGFACELPICYASISNSTLICSGRGSCTSPDNCTCHDKTGGKNCQVATNDYMIQHTFAVLLWVISGIGFIFLLLSFVTDFVFLVSLLKTIEIRVKPPKTNTEYQYVEDLNKPLLDEFK